MWFFIILDTEVKSLHPLKPN